MGVKDFHGALDKINNRNVIMILATFKDAACMTIVFESMDDGDRGQSDDHFD
ncbi:hypothetical protein O9992_25535 [Vibrio lentus]|nr:hypothetical protein [Vibrio lentus]